MGVLDRRNDVGQGKDVGDGEEEEEKLFTFSSRPTTPGDRTNELLVKFQAVSTTRPTLVSHYLTVSSRTKLIQVRRHINKYFKSVFEGGFIFLCKTKEIMKASESSLTLFDILPKMPNVEADDGGRGRRSKDVDVPSPNFMYPGVQYRKVYFNNEGIRTMATCACVVFLFERNKVSHWPPAAIREALSGNMLEGFSCIPTDIMSWKETLIEKRATQLHSYAAIGAKSDLQIAIQQMPDDIHVKDLRDNRNAVPLHYAAENGRLDICECLIAELGKEMIYQRDINMKTPLHSALYRRKKEVVVYLLQLSSDIQTKDAYGNSCADLLLRQSKDDLHFILSKLQLDCIDEDLQYQLSLYALKEGLLDYARKLTKYTKAREDPNDGQTLLHYAARVCDRQITENLLKNKFDVLARDIRGYLPFHLACEQGNDEQMALLLSHDVSDEDICVGIRILIQKKFYSSCKTIPTDRNFDMDEQTVCMMLEALDKKLTNNQNVASKKNDKQSATWKNMAKAFFPLLKFQLGTLNSYVFDCAYYGFADILVLLKSLGASFAKADNMGRTPLHEACQRKHISTVEVLLKSKEVNPNASDWRGSTPLHYACANGNLQAVKLLMKMTRIKPDISNYVGRTPLLEAAYHKHNDVLEFLLSTQAMSLNLHAVGTDGFGLLHYAIGLSEKVVDLAFDKLSSSTKKPMTPQRLKTTWSTANDVAWRKDIIETNYMSRFTGILMKSYGWRDQASGIKTDSFMNKIIDNCPQKNISKGTMPYFKSAMTPFQNKYSSTMWNSRFDESSQTEVIKSPSVSMEFCRGCCKTAGARHKCSKLARQRFPDGKETVSKSLRAFKYHHYLPYEGVSPIFTAARAGNILLIKKLIKFDPSLKTSKDELGRNLLEFVIDQGSVKLFRAIQEMQVIDETPSLIHRLIMQSSSVSDSVRKFLLQALISKGCLEDQSIECGPRIKHDGCTLVPSKPCFRNCHLLGYTPLEIVVRNRDEHLLKLIMDKGNVSRLTTPLLLAAYAGSHVILEQLAKKTIQLKRTGTATPAVQNHDDDTEETFDETDILDIACCSKFANIDVVRVISKYFPSTLSTNQTTKDKSLPKDRPYLQYDLILGSMTEISTLGKLLSNCHPLFPAITATTRNRIEDVGCFLVETGIHLGKMNIGKENGNSKYIHGACECLLNALTNGFYRVAECIIEEYGDIIWKCAYSGKSCLVQSKFKTKIYDFHSKKSHVIRYIRHVLAMAAARNTPETVMQKLLQSGKKFIPSDAAIDLEILDENIREDVKVLNDPLLKMLLCVCKQMTFAKIKIDLDDSTHFNRNQYLDVTKLIQLYPALFCYLPYIDRKLLYYESTDNVCKKIIHSSVSLVTELIFKPYLKPEVLRIQTLPLLHIFCAVDKVECVKDLVEGGIGVEINTRMKNGLAPVDVAAACGNLGVYRYLCDKEAEVSVVTLISCCRKEQFKGIGKWTKRLRTTAGQDTSSAKQRLKIVKDICRRLKTSDVSSVHDDHGSALGNALSSRIWDVAEYLLSVHNHSSASLSKVLSSQSVLDWCAEAPRKLLKDLVENIAKTDSTTNNNTLSCILLYVSQRPSSEVIDDVVKVININVAVINSTDDHGRNVFHHCAARGFLHAIKKLSTLCHDKDAGKASMNAADKSGASPLWYSLSNKHWDLANILILHGARLNTSRAVPDFVTKKTAFVKLPYPKPSIGIDRCAGIHKTYRAGGLLLDKQFPTLRKTFPHLVNSSFDIAPCIAPNISRFAKRKKYHFNPRRSIQDDKRTYQKLRTSLDSQLLSEMSKVKRRLRLSQQAHAVGCHPIHIACCTGDMHFVEQLLETLPTLVHAMDSNGYIPFTYAIMGGNIDIAKKVKSGLTEMTAAKTLQVLIWKCYATFDKKGVSVTSLSRILQLLYDHVSADLELKEVNTTHHRWDFIINSFHNGKFACSDQWDTLVGKLTIFLKEANVVEVDDIISQVAEARGRFTAFSMNPLNNQRHNELSNEDAIQLLTTVLDTMGFHNTSNIDILSLLLLPVHWVLDLLLKFLTDYQDVWERKIFWKLSMVDCLFAFASPNDERQPKYMDDSVAYRYALQNFIASTNAKLSRGIGILATKKNLWEGLECIAHNTFETTDVVNTEWHMILSSAAEKGEIKILKTVLDKLHIPRMNIQVKACFTAYLCLACDRGHTDVVKYLLRHSVPVVAALDEQPAKDILGKHYKSLWNVLHYSLRSRSELTLKAIFNAFKTEKDFVRSMTPNVYIDMASRTGIPPILDMVINFFNVTQAAQVSRSEFDNMFMNAAQRGQEDLCLHFIQEKHQDARICNAANQSVLHFCGIFGMKSLCKAVLDVYPDGLSLKDSYGYTPVAYAECLGQTLMLIETMLPLLKDDHGFLQEKIPHPCTGWFSCLLSEKQVSKNVHTETALSPHIFRVRATRLTPLEKLLTRGNDHASTLIIRAFPRMIRTMLEKSSRLFHLAARYKCNDALQSLVELQERSGERLLQEQFDIIDHGYTPLGWAVKSRNLKGVQLLINHSKKSYKETNNCWENILHIAVKTESCEIVQIIDSNFDLRDQRDKMGLTPFASSLALGLHNIARILADGRDTETTFDTHSHKVTDYTCRYCLLDLCIGWSKNFLSGQYTARPISLRPVTRTSFSGGFVDDVVMTVVQDNNHRWSLQYLTWNLIKDNVKVHIINFINSWCEISSEVMKSVLFTMGYSQETSVAEELLMSSVSDKLKQVKLSIKKEYKQAAIKMMKDLSDIDLDSVLPYAAVLGKTFVFEELQSRPQQYSAFDPAILRDAIAFGNMPLAYSLYCNFLKNELSSFFEIVQKDHFSPDEEICGTMPQNLLWLCGYQIPGDTAWTNSISQGNQRITLPDIWLTSTFSKDLQTMIDDKIDVEALIPEQCENKKFLFDLESFRKHKCLANRSEIWIRSFIASRQIFGHLRTLLEADDPRLTVVSAVKVACLPFGTSDHPKVYIDTNGTLQETISITANHDAAIVHHDNSFTQRTIEARLKDTLMNDTIPNMEHVLKNTFGLDVKVKIDWNSVEIRKRSSGTEAILKILSGEMFGNALGGLNDVILDCRDMKDAIASLLNMETADYAVDFVRTMKSIKVSFVDNLKSADIQQAARMSLSEHHWFFTIDRSALEYDRTLFPLWNVLNKYRAVCLALCDSVYRISHFHPPDTYCQLCSKTEWNHGDRSVSNYEQHPLDMKNFRSQRSLTLEVDWKSFNVNNEFTFLKLIGEGIAREIYTMAYECEAMLRMSMSTNHVILRSSASVQYTGVNLQGSTAIINVYVHQTGKKQWIVENGNTACKLAEIEDKQLALDWPFERFSNGNKMEIRAARKKIEQRFGMKIDISIDEKRLLVPLLQKCRRDLTHPRETITSAIHAFMSNLPAAYEKIFHCIFAGPSVYHTKQVKLSRGTIDPGVWKAYIPFQRKGSLPESHEILAMTNIAKSHRKTMHYDWYMRTHWKSNEGYDYHEDLRYYQRQRFQTISAEDISKTQNLVGSWKNHSLKSVLLNKDGQQRASDLQFISSDGRLFQVVEPTSLLKLLSRVNAKVAVGYDVLETLERNAIERAVHKIYPSLRKDMYDFRPLQSVPFLHDALQITNNFEGSQHLPFIYVEWKTFESEKKNASKDERNLQIVVENLRDTLKSLFQMKSISCPGNTEKHSPEYETIRKIAMLRLKKIPTDFVPDASQDRVLSTSEKGLPTFYLRRTYEVTIAYQNLLNLKPYETLFQKALVELLELEVKNNILRYLDRKPTERKKSKVKIEVAQAHRPHTDLFLAVRVLPELLKTIKYLMQDLPAIKRELSDEFVDFQFARSESNTSSIRYKNGLLIYAISPCDLSKDLSRKLVVALELPFPNNGLDIKPMLNYDGPAVHFSASDESSIVISVKSRYGNPISQDDMVKLYDPESYFLKVWKDKTNSASVPITRVERGEKESCIQLFWNADGFKPNKKRNIQLFYLNRGVADPATMFFHGNEPLSKMTRHEDNGRYSITKGGYMICMAEHDTTCLIPCEEKQRESAQETFGFISFILTAKKPKHPRYEPAIPVAIKCIETRDNLPRTECFQILCEDDLREVHVQAKCVKCGFKLKIITPLEIIHPNKQLIINK